MIGEPRSRDREFFRALVELAPEPIGVVRNGRLIYANAACLGVLGFADRGEAYRTPLSALLSEPENTLRTAREEAILAGRERARIG